MLFGQLQSDFLLGEHGGGVNDCLFSVVIKVAVTENVNEYVRFRLTLYRTRKRMELHVLARFAHNCIVALYISRSLFYLFNCFYVIELYAMDESHKSVSTIQYFSFINDDRIELFINIQKIKAMNKAGLAQILFSFNIQFKFTHSKQLTANKNLQMNLIAQINTISNKSSSLQSIETQREDSPLSKNQNSNTQNTHTNRNQIRQQNITEVPSVFTNLKTQIVLTLTILAFILLCFIQIDYNIFGRQLPDEQRPNELEEQRHSIYQNQLANNEQPQPNLFKADDKDNKIYKIQLQNKGNQNDKLVSYKNQITTQPKRQQLSANSKSIDPSHNANSVQINKMKSNNQQDNNKIQPQRQSRQQKLKQIKRRYQGKKTQTKKKQQKKNILHSIPNHSYSQDTYANLSQYDIKRAKKWRYMSQITINTINPIVQQQRLYYNNKYEINKYEELPFCLVVPTFQNQPQKRAFLNMRSIIMQNYSNYRVIVIDDGSKDKTSNVITDFLQNQPYLDANRFKVITNKQKKFALANVLHAARTFCKPEDIMMVIDGDDELLGRQVLKLFNSVFQSKGVWLMYTNFISSIGTMGYSRPYPPDIIEKDDYRTYGFTVTHLRAFYTKLLLNVKDQDMQDEKGIYFTSAGDMSYVMPMLEMAHKRIIYIPEITYLYNINTGKNIHKKRQQEQRLNNLKIRAKKRYAPLQTLF